MLSFRADSDADAGAASPAPAGPSRRLGSDPYSLPPPGPGFDQFSKRDGRSRFDMTIGQIRAVTLRQLVKSESEARMCD